MDKRMYPTGNTIVPSSQIETTCTAADMIQTVRSYISEKWISLTNLFASPPAIGGTSPSAGTFTTATATKLMVSETSYTASGAISADASFVALNKSDGALAMTIAAPAAGRLLVIYQKDSGTSGHTVTLTAGTYNGTNTIATFNAQNECLVLFGITATRFVILENLGSVGLS